PRDYRWRGRRGRCPRSGNEGRATMDGGCWKPGEGLEVAEAAALIAVVSGPLKIPAPRAEARSASRCTGNRSTPGADRRSTLAGHRGTRVAQRRHTRTAPLDETADGDTPS